VSLKHALLGLLAESPASGYDLLKRFNTSLAFVWPAKQSQVYAELGRLAEEGLISVTGTGARNRTEYGITAEGLAELRHWLATDDGERTYRSGPLLRVFFLWTLPPAARAEYLDGFARELEERQIEFRRLRDETDWGDTDIDKCARVVLEFGLRSSAVTEEWASWAAQQLGA
jgi:DNA-binding PadR family transcriptional regulator